MKTDVTFVKTVVILSVIKIYKTIYANIKTTNTTKYLNTFLKFIFLCIK